MNTSRSGSERSRQPQESVQTRAMKSVCEYNRQLNQERKEDRKVCMDLQTYTIHYPTGLGKDHKELRKLAKRLSNRESLERRYPVALLPNQYQDWYVPYTSNEMKYFPLNTAIYGPVPMQDDPGKAPHSLAGAGDDSSSEFEGSDVLSDLDDDSVCSCGEEHDIPAKASSHPSSDDSDFAELNSRSNLEFGTKTSLQGLNFDSALNTQTDHQQQAKCRMCMKEISGEDVLKCADCGSTSHPACIEIGGELLQAIRLYRWQCMDCKSCNQCGQPHDEDKMMFCDRCDRGYHTYCVGLSAIPDGHWVCALCAICSNCGLKKLGNVSNWFHELQQILNPTTGETYKRHQIFCENCHKNRPRN